MCQSSGVDSAVRINEGIEELLTQGQQSGSALIQGWKNCNGWIQGTIEVQDTKGLYIIAMRDDLESVPLVAFLHYKDVERQCKSQGFEGETTMTLVWESTVARLIRHSTLDFTVHEDKITITSKLTNSMNVALVCDCYEIHKPVVVARVYGSLCKDTISIGLNYRRRNKSLLDTMEGKDSAVKYLEYLVNDLGGSSILERWAPRGSINYANLSAYDESHTRNADSYSTDKVANLSRGDMKHFFHVAGELNISPDTDVFSSRKLGNQSPSHEPSSDGDCDGDGDDIARSGSSDKSHTFTLPKLHDSGDSVVDGKEGTSQESTSNTQKQNRSCSVDDPQVSPHRSRKKRKFGRIKTGD